MPEPAPHERRPRMPATSGERDAAGPPRRRWPRPGFLALIIGALALNWVLSQVIAPPERSITVPYSPTFLNEVRAGNVARISPLGETVTGEFKTSVADPDDKSSKAKQFDTEIPQFTNGD